MSEASTSDVPESCTYRFSDRDRDLIFSQIEDSIAITPQVTTEVDDTAQQLESLRRKETSLSLHLSTLAEYLKVKRIPRGLRTTLTPNLLTDDTEYVRKWYGLCNQFSQDLMLLTVQHLQLKLQAIKGDITRIEAELSNSVPPEQYTVISNNIDQIVEKQKENILKVKTRKLARDAKDYEQNEVYSWNKKRKNLRGSPNKQNKPQSQRSPAGQSNSTDSETSTSSDNKKKRRSFLARPPLPPAEEEAGEGPAPQPFRTNPRPQTRAWSGRSRGRGRSNQRW